MKVADMIGTLGLSVLAKGGAEEVLGCYIGDLLSRVISRGIPGGMWITIMNNMNVPAVALLADIPCIVLCEGVQPMEGVAQRCEKEGIWLLQSRENAFQLACALAGKI